jgi:hypothetical protein
VTRIVPIEVATPRTGTGERRQPESNRCRVPVVAVLLAAIVALTTPAPAAAKCRTKACWQRVHAARAEAWLKRERPAVWEWRRQPASWKRWAHSTSWCESGHRAHTSTGNGFYGAFQFLPRTWYASMRYVAPRLRTSRMPHVLRWEHQAVVAIALARNESPSHWPVCGR